MFFRMFTCLKHKSVGFDKNNIIEFSYICILYNKNCLKDCYSSINLLPTVSVVFIKYKNNMKAFFCLCYKNHNFVLFHLQKYD